MQLKIVQVKNHLTWTARYKEKFKFSFGLKLIFNLKPVGKNSEQIYWGPL